MTIFKKLWYLLNHLQRRATITLSGLMLVGMVLETLGIGLIIPALALMTKKDSLDKYRGLVPWLNSLGDLSPEQLVISGMLVLVGVYTTKTVFLAFLAWRQANFVYELQADLSHRLFSGYLRQPYTFHLQRNSAQLIRNIIGQVTDFTSVLQQGLVMMTELLVLVGISVLLFAVEPIGALLVVSTLGLVGWGFHKFTRRRILNWGEARQLHEGHRIQHLQQGLGGVKDVKLFGREDHFLTQYHAHNVGSAKAAQYQVTLKALPRLGLELLAVTGLAVLVMVMISQGKALDSLLPTIGVFAAAAFRLMPSVNRVLVAIQGVRFYLPVIDTLQNELCQLEDIKIARGGGITPLGNMITLEQICFAYPPSETGVLYEVDLKIPYGLSIGLIGSSGSGKSTLVDVILGLLTPQKGAVKADGVDIQMNLRGWQDQIGYVPQSIFLTDDTLRRNIAFGLPNEQIEESAIWKALRASQLEQFVNDLPDGLDTLVGERGIRLSGGQRQRIGIARALYHDPPVLVLDEATSSLDIATEKGFMNAVHALHGEKTIIIVAHRLSTVAHCDSLIRLDKGRVVNEDELLIDLRKQNISTTTA